MNAFDSQRASEFSALDIALVEALASIWPGSDVAALNLAALTSWAVGKGHSCFTADLLPESPDRVEAESKGCPADTLREALRDGNWPRAGFIGDPASTAPIVVDGGRAWLRRYWRYEREIEAALRMRSIPFATRPDAGEVRAALDRVLPLADPGESDWQRVAAANALRTGLAVMCGGPGTGKTYTALRVLALIRLFAGRRLRMGLAAPTGKAAQRLSESVRLGLQTIPLTDEQRADLPDEAMTLHRLLGFRPQSVQPARNASNPLDLDVLVVDECSMVDLPLMAKLLRALKPECRLVLLGDPDQLPAVENGAVLASLAAENPSNRFGKVTARWIEASCGDPVAVRSDSSAIGDCVVRLERPRRFGGDSGIARVVRAIRGGDPQDVFDALSGGGDVHWNEQAWRPDSSAARERFRESYAALGAAGSPSAALDELGRYRILCALREGPHGVAGINQAVASVLHGARAVQPFVAGRPLLITSNQHALGLFNGDVGIVLAERPDAPLRAWFARSDGSLHAFLPAQLPANESAYAMTVHKAQGSEFDTVELVLPSTPHPLLTREWFYTAASRARRELRIHASRDVIVAALGRTTRRVNGMVFRD